MLYVIIAVVTAVIAAGAAWYAANKSRDKKDADALQSAQTKARQIIDDALKQADSTKKETLLAAKEEALRSKNEAEREFRERRAEISKNEHRVQNKEEQLDKKADSLEKREQELARKEDDLSKARKQVDTLTAKRLQELERISGLTSEQAKEVLLKSVEESVKHDAAVMIKN
ncbi:MAG: Rnase Y domain-containing protein, partial [Lachnospiraceae bacterium]|nr:Rnase Y domain-containing protein [Lachnospiraceae bacterium]